MGETKARVVDLAQDRLVSLVSGISERAKAENEHLPGSTEINDVRALLVEYSQQSAGSAGAERLKDALDDAEERVCETHIGQVQASLMFLAEQKAYASSINDVIARAEDALRELAGLGSDQASALREELREEQRRQDGLRLVQEGQSELDRNVKSIQELEKTQHSNVAVEAASELYHDAERRVAKGQELQVPSEADQILRSQSSEAKGFWDRLRAAYVDALTADMDQDFAKAKAIFESRKEADGSDALVNYYPSVEAATPALIRVAEALDVCEERWRMTISRRAQGHLDSASRALSEGDPRAAKTHLDEVVSPRKNLDLERLNPATRADLESVQRAYEADIETLLAFEAQIRSARDLAPIPAWRRLAYLGNPFARFTAASNLWHEEQALARKRASEHVRRNLARASDLLWHDQIDESMFLAESTCQELEGLEEDFERESSDAGLVHKSVTGIQAARDVAQEALRSKDIAGAEDALKDLEIATGVVQRFVPGEGRELPKQATLAALQRSLMALNDASGLLQEYTKELEDWGARADNRGSAALLGLKQEIDEHVTRVPSSIQTDFQRVRKAIHAEYGLQWARESLAVVGDRDSVLNALKPALSHPRTETEAQALRAEILNRLKPADDAVREAISRCRDHLSRNAPWDAYQTARQAGRQPAHPDLKAELDRCQTEAKRLALLESRSVAEDALASNPCEPDDLREHVRRLLVLDREFHDSNHQQLELTAWLSEATNHCARRNWRSARDAYRAASRIIRAEPELGEEGEADRLIVAGKGAEKAYLLHLETSMGAQGYRDALRNALEAGFPQDPDLLLARVRAVHALLLESEVEPYDPGAISNAVELCAEAFRDAESARRAAERSLLPDGVAPYDESWWSLADMSADSPSLRAKEARECVSRARSLLRLSEAKRRILVQMESVVDEQGGLDPGPQTVQSIVFAAGQLERTANAIQMIGSEYEQLLREWWSRVRDRAVEALAGGYGSMNRRSSYVELWRSVCLGLLGAEIDLQDAVDNLATLCSIELEPAVDTFVKNRAQSLGAEEPWRFLRTQIDQGRRIYERALDAQAAARRLVEQSAARSGRTDKLDEIRQQVKTKAANRVSKCLIELQELREVFDHVVPFLRAAYAGDSRAAWEEIKRRMSLVNQGYTHHYSYVWLRETRDRLQSRRREVSAMMDTIVSAVRYEYVEALEELPTATGQNRMFDNALNRVGELRDESLSDPLGVTALPEYASVAVEKLESIAEPTDEYYEVCAGDTWDKVSFVEGCQERFMETLSDQLIETLGQVPLESFLNSRCAAVSAARSAMRQLVRGGIDPLVTLLPSVMESWIDQMRCAEFAEAAALCEHHITASNGKGSTASTAAIVAGLDERIRMHRSDGGEAIEQWWTIHLEIQRESIQRELECIRALREKGVDLEKRAKQLRGQLDLKHQQHMSLAKRVSRRWLWSRKRRRARIEESREGVASTVRSLAGLVPMAPWIGSHCVRYAVNKVSDVDSWKDQHLPECARVVGS